MLTASCAQAQPFNINYTLPSSGKVSLAVYDSGGKIVRTLLNAAPQTTGTQSVVWDGKNDDGVAVPNASTCTWKVLRTPGMSAKHLLFAGSSFPRGSAYWESGLGNHYGPRSVAIDTTGVYAGAGGSENMRNALKMDLAGSTCLWSAWQPQAWQGRFAMSVLNSNVYFLQQNGRVAWHGVNTPNQKDQSVGDPTKWSTGGAWSALWTGDTTDANSWGEAPDAQTMDMYAADINSVATVVVSYKEHDAVRWYNASTGTIIATVTGITSPTGVTVDNNGNVLVLSSGRLLKVTQSGTQTTLISGLTSPWRVDVDRTPSPGATRGYIYIAEQGSSQRVKVFSPTYAAVGTPLGASGGRQQGLYTRTNFKDVVDITSDRAGGFFVVETSAPRRVARFQANGTFVKEWAGGQDWVPAISVDPSDPTVAWMICDDSQIMRLKMDYTAGTWSVHSTYVYAGLASGLIGKGKALGSGGYDSWHVRKRGTDTYLVRRGSMQVLKVDQTNWTLKAVVVGKIAPPGTANASFLWTDANGDGAVQETEKAYYGTWGEELHDQLFKTAPAGFDYFRFEKNGPIIKHGLQAGTNFNSVGAPLYQPLNTAPNFAVLPGRSPYDLIYQNPPTIFGRESDTGPLYVAINAYSTTEGSEWGQTPFNRMYKFSANGTYEWSVGKHQPRPGSEPETPPTPGSIYTFKNVVGVVNGTVVATDFDGGWSGGPSAITYAWDRDGLYVGGLFDNIDSAAAAEDWYYIHNTDNGTGEMCVEPSTGEVLYFASGENDCRIYRISGWNGWTRLSGNFTSTAGPIVSGTYKLVNRNSGKALDVAGATSTDGSEIQQWTYTGASNQQWQLTDLGNGYYKIIASHSLKSMDVPGSNLADGTLIKQYPYNGGDNQLFQITSLGSGYYKITVKHSGKSLDIIQASTTNGARLQQWGYMGNLNQQWQILAP